LSREKIQTQFQIEESGGMIDFTTKDPNNKALRDSLRLYGKTLEKTLRNGQFDMLLTFLPPNPEFVNWVTKNGGVGFSVIELPTGVRLDITVSNQAARTAVHEFIRRVRGNTLLTGEEKRRNHPGINPGRDTEPADPKK
jgi:hypothetical protein